MKSLFVSLAVLLVFASVALAVPAGKTITFEKSTMGKVVFAGEIHKNAGIKCAECHNPNLFPKMKQGTVSIKMDAINKGELCGFCHNGQRAFAPAGNCSRCHTK